MRYCCVRPTRDLALRVRSSGGLHYPRRPELVRYHLDELLRERIYSLALGYNTDDEVDHLARDPAMRGGASLRVHFDENAGPIG